MANMWKWQDRVHIIEILFNNRETDPLIFSMKLFLVGLFGQFNSYSVGDEGQVDQTVGPPTI